MTKVKITSGLYGHRAQGAKFMEPVRAGYCCIVSDEEAERLVRLGIAAYIGAAVVENEQKRAAHDEETGGRPSYDADTKLDVLRGLMKDCLLPIPFGIKKETMVEELDKYYARLEEAEDECEDEDAPVLDEGEEDERSDDDDADSEAEGAQPPELGAEAPLL